MTAIQGDRSEEFNTYGVHYTNETVADTADADTVDKCARSSPADVIWRCSKCRAYLEVCAKVPKQVDAFTSAAGRKHSDCKEIDIFRQHEKSDFHQQALKHEATEVGDKAAGKNTTQPKMPDVLTPEEELQNNYILGVIWLVVFQVALCLIGPLRDLAQCWGVSMPPAMSHYQTLEIIDAIYEMAIALDTACAERWFSKMAILKDKKRNRMDDALLNKLMFICLHAPKSITALKNIVDDVRLIWKEKKDRYKAKWVEWEAVADEMALDELALNEHY